MNEKDLKMILEEYGLCDKIKNIEYIDSGLINKTFLITINNDFDKKYILQQMSTSAYPDIDKLMNNCVAFAKNINVHVAYCEDSQRKALEYLQTRKGDYYFQIEDRYYRIMKYIPNAVAYDFPISSKMVYDAGKIIGEIESYFVDFDLKQMQVSIPMHNTPIILKNFENIIKDDCLGRVNQVKELIDCFLANKSYADILMKPLSSGEIPMRVVHNDTKFNNILFDKKTNEPLTLIDFDNSMIGTWLFDYSDAIRYMCNTAPGLENEVDLSKVKFNVEFFKEFTKGYLDSIGKFLTPSEIKLLAISPAVIAYELGIRFLSDYLCGDHIFALKDGQSNLQRARVQFKMFQEIINNLPHLESIVNDIVNI